MNIEKPPAGKHIDIHRISVSSTHRQVDCRATCECHKTCHVNLYVFNRTFNLNCFQEVYSILRITQTFLFLKIPKKFFNIKKVQEALES